MALDKQKKAAVIAETGELLSHSKMTVIARYSGTTVAALQQLRNQARDNGTVIRVIKNRLMIKSLAADERFAAVDTSPLRGQLLYAFNDQDEVAPAQVLAAFVKNEPQISFVAALNAEGQLLDAEEVKVLAALPGKQQLRGQLAGNLNGPLTGLLGALQGNLRGLASALQARAEQLSQQSV